MKHVTIWKQKAVFVDFEAMLLLEERAPTRLLQEADTVAAHFVRRAKQEFDVNIEIDLWLFRKHVRQFRRENKAAEDGELTQEIYVNLLSFYEFVSRLEKKSNIVSFPPH